MFYIDLSLILAHINPSGLPQVLAKEGSDHVQSGLDSTPDQDPDLPLFQTLSNLTFLMLLLNLPVPSGFL